MSITHISAQQAPHRHRRLLESASTYNAIASAIDCCRRPNCRAKKKKIDHDEHAQRNLILPNHLLCLPLVRNVEHIAADIYAKPDVAGFFQRFSAETAPTPHVENEARLPRLRSMSMRAVFQCKRKTWACQRSGRRQERQNDRHTTADICSCVVCTGRTHIDKPWNASNTGLNCVHAYYRDNAPETLQFL